MVNHVRIYINYIIKFKFFIAFIIIYKIIITPKNIIAKFRGTKLVPYDLEAVLSKLNIKLRMLILTNPSFTDINP